MVRHRGLGCGRRCGVDGAFLVAEALQKGTTQAALLGAIGVAATLAVAWAATLYILARGEISRAATQPAAIPGSE